MCYIPCDYKRTLARCFALNVTTTICSVQVFHSVWLQQYSVWLQQYDMSNWCCIQCDYNNMLCPSVPFSVTTTIWLVHVFHSVWLQPYSVWLKQYALQLVLYSVWLQQYTLSNLCCIQCDYNNILCPGVPFSVTTTILSVTTTIYVQLRSTQCDYNNMVCPTALHSVWLQQYSVWLQQYVLSNFCCIQCDYNNVLLPTALHSVWLQQYSVWLHQYALSNLSSTQCDYNNVLSTCLQCGDRSCPNTLMQTYTSISGLLTYRISSRSNASLIQITSFSSTMSRLWDRIYTDHFPQLVDPVPFLSIRLCLLGYHTHLTQSLRLKPPDWKGRMRWASVSCFRRVGEFKPTSSNIGRVKPMTYKCIPVAS